MTFPLKEVPAHPSCPRRPKYDEEHVRHPPRRLYSEVPLGRPGLSRQISTTQDRLHISQMVNGRPRRSFRFETKDVGTLERAIEISKEPDGPKRNAGSIALAVGGWIEVGAGPSVVIMRLVLATGEVSVGSHIHLEGAELVAFAMAVHDFAARAAFEKKVLR